MPNSFRLEASISAGARAGLESCRLAHVRMVWALNGPNECSNHVRSCADA